MLQSKGSLLLVDDDVVLRQALHAAFVALGYNVRSAADGFGALDVMREEMPDILLSDLQMPGMSGFELLYVVHRRFPSIRVVAMSGAYSGEQIPEGVAAHAFHAKGTRPQALFQTIDAMAANRRDALMQSDLSSTLIWIARNIHDCSGQAYVLIACPDCLRTFPELLDHEDAIHESKCVYCSTPLRYAIVQASTPTLLPPTTPRLASADGDGRSLTSNAA